MGKTYAVSDLHGRYDLYEKIKEIISPEDTVYFLGDANDRGPDGWKLIKAIYEDPQFIYLMGNHEDMLANAMAEFDNYDLQLLYYNGGEKTYEDWLADPDRNSWYSKLKNLPKHWEYHRLDGRIVFLCHSGCTPHGYPKVEWSGGILWNRDHFLDPWDSTVGDNCYMVHGHTPINYLQEDLEYLRETELTGPLFYCDGHKIDIDCLSAFSGMACLLNLDTFEYIMIEDELHG